MQRLFLNWIDQFRGRPGEAPPAPGESVGGDDGNSCRFSLEIKMADGKKTMPAGSDRVRFRWRAARRGRTGAGMGLAGGLMAALVGLLAPIVSAQVPGELIRNYTPPAWQAAEVKWVRDQEPRNKVDDTIDRGTNAEYHVVVNFKRCLDQGDIVQLLPDGNPNLLQMKLKYLSSAAVGPLTKAQVYRMAASQDVAFIEQQFGFTATLNTSLESICVTAGACSPTTLAANGAGVNIVVMDSGVDNATHSAFAGAFVAGYDATVSPGVFVDPPDDLGHGTHVASIALGRPWTSAGVNFRGTAPAAGLIDVRVFTAGTSCGAPGTWPRFIDGLQTVYDNRASWNVGVINMSFRNCDSAGLPVISDGNDAFSQLVDLAETMGIVVVAAAGNDGAAGMASPAAATRAITVAASETMNTGNISDDRLACFSTLGPRVSDGDSDTLDERKPDVTAPGTHLMTATCVQTRGITAARMGTANGVVQQSGTSMAAPQVAGVAALILQTRPGINAASVKHMILTTARPIAAETIVGSGWNSGSGYGVISAAAALDVARQTDLTFLSHPADPGWLSPDISTDPFPPSVGATTTVKARIRNNGPAPATGVRVQFGVHVFSASSYTFQDIGTRVVDIPVHVAPGTFTEVTIPWVPAHASHQCLKVEIGYGPDTDYSNNSAQRNVTVQNSPATFAVQNTVTEAPALIQLVPTWGTNSTGTKGGSNWTFVLEPREVRLGAADCPAQVNAELFPGPNVRPGERQTLNIAAVINTFFGRIELGGVTVQAVNPELKIIAIARQGEQVEIRAQGPAGTTITLQRTTKLGGEWSDLPGAVLSNGRPFSFFDQLSPNLPTAFYRLKGAANDVVAFTDGQTWTLRAAGQVPIEQVIDVLGLNAGGDTFLSPRADAPDLVGPFDLKDDNLEELLARANLPIWLTPPAIDDPALTGRFVRPNGLQVNPLPPVPGEVGVGVISNNVPDNPNFPRPMETAANPPLPSPNSDKGFLPDIQPVADGVRQIAQTNGPSFDKHLRLQVAVGLNGGLRLGFAGLQDDPATLFELAPRPAVGSVVWVVRSPTAGANAPGGIYYVNSLIDPFETRSYNPPAPLIGIHGNAVAAEASIRIPVPLLDQNLGELTVEFYRCVGGFEGDALSAETFLKNQRVLEALGTLKGEEIRANLALFNGVPGGMFQAAAASRAPTMTQVHRSGSRGQKFNIVVIGDGYRDTPADQTLFNNYVNDVIVRDFFGADVQDEIMNAFNIFRINTYSVDSGVTHVDADGNVTTARSTALEWRFSGIWARCWVEGSPNSGTLLNNAINGLLPEADLIFLVLNEPSYGGCAGGNLFVVPSGVDWSVVAHEFGHMYGGLADEYIGCTGPLGTYSGPEPGSPNLTATTVRSAVKWKEWIPWWRPLPTRQSDVGDYSQDVGLFTGYYCATNGIYKPSFQGRMQNNWPPHNPVGYSRFRDLARPKQQGDFRQSAVGDFNGDGRTDFVMIDDRQLSLYLAADRTAGPNDPVVGRAPRSVTGVLEPAWFQTDILWNPARTRSWEFRSNDILLPGDFDGDGKTDLYVVNLVDWIYPYVCLLRSTGSGFEPVRRFDRDLPGWGAMLRHDEFYVGDYNGDGRADLMVYNGRDWSVPYFLMLRSTGNDLAYSRRYDRFLPGWEMGRNEKFAVGDFNGDGRKEVVSQNTADWSQVHLMVFTSTGSQLQLADRHYGTVLYPFWTMRRTDRLHVLDFSGDRRSDLAIFNGHDWSTEYLGLLTCSTNGQLRGARRYDDIIPGWNMRPQDRFVVADFNGDGRQDLVVFNANNWSTEYLGMLRSDGEGALRGSWQADWIGSWNLGTVDAFHVGDFRGAAGWQDLFVYNKNWLGLLRSYRESYALEAIYPKWIHNHRYHQYGWW